jgi:hypothetical protein
MFNGVDAKLLGKGRIRMHLFYIQSFGMFLIHLIALTILPNASIVQPIILVFVYHG